MATNNSLAPTSIPGRIRMQYRQCVASPVALSGHLLLRSCRSDARGANTQSKLLIEIVVGIDNFITRLYATPDPRLSVGLKPSTNVGAGCSCHRPAPNIIARLAFLCILSVCPFPGRRCPMARKQGRVLRADRARGWCAYLASARIGALRCPLIARSAGSWGGYPTARYSSRLAPTH